MAEATIIALTTDFGLADPYVAAMKAVILAINPHTLIVDVSHQVRPQGIEQGAFLLEAVIPYFPPGTIHLAVVDPGVGSARRALALRTPVAILVGPDNGLLSAALPAHLRAQASPPTSRLPLPQGFQAVSLENHRYFRHPVSATFHGRDIFAPVAAYLSLGLSLAELGPSLESMLVLPPFRAVRQPDGSLGGRILHIDRFGNLITDVRQDDLSTGSISVEVAGRRIEGLSRTYGQGLIAYIGSFGHLEIALVGGDASRALGADIGTPLLVYPRAKG